MESGRLSTVLAYYDTMLNCINTFRLILLFWSPANHDTTSTALVGPDMYHPFQKTMPYLQLRLGGLQRRQQQIADIARSLVEVEAHPGAPETF